MISAYQEKRLVDQLDQMAEVATDGKQLTMPYEVIGKLQYMIWEARQTLGLPDIEGLTPV